MSNRFYTILIVPEKTAQVRRIVVPSWLFKGAAFGFAVVTLVSMIMMLDYWFVMNQINENKQLKIDNRRLRQQVQVFKNKMTTVETTMDRVKSFATRLKVITNIEDRGSLLQSLNGPLPDSSKSIVDAPMPLAPPVAKAASSTPAGDSAASAPTAKAVPTSAEKPLASASAPPAANAPQPSSAQAQLATLAGAENPADAEADAILRQDYELLDMQFSTLNRESLYLEQMLQDEYELLADQKSFLSALPTRKPVVGYFTSGFGIRSAPFGGRVKMHEGLDIANRPGTPVHAPADGVVTWADVKSGYGQTLVIDHGYGLETWYAHARKLVAKKGQKIHRGDVIAQLGNTGRSTGPHLHYEVRVHGTPVNPLSYILEN